MKKLIWFLLVFLAVGIGIGLRLWQKSLPVISPLGNQEIKAKPLDKYTFDNLRLRGGVASQIELGEVLNQAEGFTSQMFFYQSEERRISGLINLPEGKGPFPVIIMLRGWVDPDNYQTGVGTSRTGEALAQAGFLTLAPDFLGYGQSDEPPDDVWEERFLKPVAVLDLLSSVKHLPQSDPQKIGIWSHSNGGMVALSVLEITGQEYPTTLWAPVSKSFPYDILYYTDEYDDRGKLLRQKLAQFETDYDVNHYSFTEYLDWLKGPLQVHQGTFDDSVPVDWTNELVEMIKALEIDIDYYVYPGADHNLKGSWQTVVNRDINFFKQTLATGV